MPNPWDGRTVIGLFCDPYVAKTCPDSEEALRDVSGWLSELKKVDQLSSKVKTVLEEAEELFAEGARLGSAGRGAFNAAWCEDLKRRLEKLKPGELYIAPGGWRHNQGVHAIIYVFQRVSDSEYKFAVCNTGEGVEYHPQDAGPGVFPKEKRVTSWLLKGIPQEKILDELWLYSLFKIYYTRADCHKPVMLYEVLLPLILPSGDVREQTDPSWSTPATCQHAASCYKCIPAALRLILHIRGVEEPERKLLMYFLRLQQVSRIHEALKDTQLEAMTESDFMVVECACRQMARKVLHQKSISNEDKESARRLIADVDVKVAEAREVQRKALAAKAMGINRGVREDFVGYSGFPGWELLSVPWFGHGNKDAYDHLMGSKTSRSWGQHVDIAALHELSGYELINETAKMCDELENNGLEEISKLRIGALIEDVMIRQFPAGHPDWEQDFDLETQKRILADLWRLTQHYVAAVASSTTARTQVAAQILTMRSLHAAFETCLRRAAEDGMLPTTQAIICPVAGGNDRDTVYRLSWSFTGVADLWGKSASDATDGLPLSTPKLAEARNALARHEAGAAAKGDGAWDSSWNGLQYDASFLTPTQELVDDLTEKVLKIMSDVLPPKHDAEWPLWTVPFGWALSSQGEIQQEAPEFYFWRDICVWCKYLCLDPQFRRFKGVFSANAASIQWSVTYCEKYEIVKAQPSALNGTINFDQLARGYTSISGASLQAAGLVKGISEDDVILAPTLPTFGQALAQEEAERVLCALTAPYLRIPLLLHFLAADRLHALNQTSMQEMLWAALMEPAVWADDDNPKPVEQAPELPRELGTSFGLLHNEVLKGFSGIAAPFCALCGQADELASLAPPKEYDGPPAEILQFFVRLCSRFLDQLYNQGMEEREPEVTRTLKIFLEEKAVTHLRRWIRASSQEINLRCRLHAHMALTCLQRDMSDAENLILLLSSCSYVMAWYDCQFSETFGTELQMVFEVVQRRRVEVIAAVNNSPKRKYILDQASKITSNFFTSETDRWSREPGAGIWKCEKKDGSAVFNLQTCTLWLESGLLGPIPPKLRRTAQFAEFCRMHPAKLQPTCRPLRLARNCHMLLAMDDQGKAFELQWWSSIQQQSNYVKPEDQEGLKWKANGSCTGVGMPWKQDDKWRLPGGIECEKQDVHSWLKELGQDELAEVWERLLSFARDPGNHDEGTALKPLLNPWYCQSNELNAAKDFVAIQYIDRNGFLEARFACGGHPIIRVFAHSDFGRHCFRSEIFCSDAAFSYASLVPDDKDREERPLCNPQFAGRTQPGLFREVETLAIVDDSKRLWVPPVALQGLLPAVLLEGCRFWAEEKHGVVSFTGKPYNPPVYNSLTYTLQVTCEDGIAKVTRQVGDETWVLASPIHAPSGSQIERFAAILGPLEAMSHVLFWTEKEGTAVCMVELPRAQLRFVPGPDPNNCGLRLFSKEFGGFYLLNRSGVYDPEAWQETTGDPRATDLAAFLAKMPHAVVLKSAAGAIRILVTNADVTRPSIKCKPFSTDLVVNRKILVALSGKTFLWDFHESGSLLLTSSLSGTLYLSLLTLLHREYTSCARLIGSIGFDEGISGEELSLLEMTLFSTAKDQHPDASALRLKLVLALIAHNPHHYLLASDKYKKLIAADYCDYLEKLTHVSQSCQLQLREEGVLLRNMQENKCKSWQQADNRFKFVEAVENGRYGSPACVLRYVSAHPASDRSRLLGFQAFQQKMQEFTQNRWNENFTVDMNDEGKHRSDLESLVELMDRCDREDWTSSGKLFFTLYAILTGTSKVSLNGQDVTKRLVRLCIEKFWLRLIRLRYPSGDTVRTVCTLWSVLGMHAMDMTDGLPPWQDAAKLCKESKRGSMNSSEESSGLKFFNDLYKALESGYSCAESLVPEVACNETTKVKKLTISDEAMPRFSPPCAPRLTDFARKSCDLQGEEAEVLSMLSLPLKSISDQFMGEFEESLSIPDCPFTEERLTGLPGGMTRMGARIIKGKLEGHGVFMERSKKKKGFGLKCLPAVPDEAALESSLETLKELEAEVKRCWSHDLEKVVSLRKELLKKADFAPQGGEGTPFWLGRRGGIEGHLWLEWCVGSELDSVREFTGCTAAVNKVVAKDVAAEVGRGILGLMLYVNRVAQAQLVLGRVQDLRAAVQRTQRKGIDEVACKELQTLGGQVAMFLGCRRNYTTESNTPEISPAFLLFEYVTGFMVRKQQVDLIQRFADEAFAGRSLVAQMIMGAGKTTCIAPMLTLLLGNNGRLVLNIVPRALLAQTRNVMRTMFGQILAKRVVTLEFSRMMGQDNPFDVQLVKMQLFDAQRDAAVVCTTPTAIKSMFLRHLELLQLNHILTHNMDECKKQMTKATDSVSQTRIKKRMDDASKELNGNRVMAGFIGEVLGMLRNNSCALIDEVDLVLHPLKSELNFPIGSLEMFDLSCERWHLAVHLLDALFLNDEGHAAAGLFYPDIRNCSGKVGEAVAKRISQLEVEIPDIVKKGYDLLTLQKQPHLVLLSRVWYDKNLLRPLADWLAGWIVTHAEAKKFRESVEYTDVCEFLAMDLTDLLKSEVKSKVESKAHATIGKLLCLGREWLFDLLPHVLSKVNRVQYGLLTERELSLAENEKAPSSRRLLAVPFVAKDKPSPAAEFAQPDVLIGFTVLAYRYEGMRLSDCVSMLHHLQMKSGRESGPWSARPTCVLFERWKEIGTKRYKEKGGKSSVEGLSPLNWEIYLDDDWQKLPSDITELLREAVAKKQRKVKFSGFGSQPYEIDLEKMVQVNRRSKKARDIRQVQETARGEDLKLPELQALSSSTRDEEAKKKKEKEKKEKEREGDEAKKDPLLRGPEAEEQKPEGHAQVAVELLGPVPEIVLWYLLTLVFDTVLRQQPQKLSATGQELGSSMLFGSRIGFSGTPSSLLPEDLGECLFEAENEGEILSVLSDEQHVVPPLINLASDWSPESILNMVARSTDPVYHCLIDTGALVTRFTNEEVAALLLKLLPHDLFDGVAYFDDRDAPMVILRNAVRPALLSEAGVPMDRRFTFFDQVHTTGTDTKQPLQSYAALTLSASMTFRDYAQGAWRMRGLGKGQKLRMIIAPELAKKVRGIVKAEGEHGELGLHDAVAFMLSNQFDSEGKQFAALQLQNLATVWRKHALNDLMEKEVKLRESKKMRPQVEAFLESLRFPVETKVHEPLTLDQKMRKQTDEQAYIMNDDEKAHCDKLIKDVMGSKDGGDLGAEITRQQEKEQEKLMEKMKEIEVYVGREREREVEWPLKILQKENEPEESGVFFQLANFQMAGLKTKLNCTGNALISSNHTTNALTTLNVRRMKSVLIMLVVGSKTMAVSTAEAAALRRAKHLNSEHLPDNANLWICSGSKKIPEGSLNLFGKDSARMVDPSPRGRRPEAARCLLRFFNCDLDFRPDEVTSTVKALEAGAAPKQRQHFVETVLGARRRETCDWRDTSLGEIVRGDGAKLEERERLVQSLYGLMKARFKSAGDFFKVLDVNGFGVIQHEAFQRSMKKVFEGAFSPEDVRKIFIAADSSGRGNVTSQDLCHLLQCGAPAVMSDETPGADADGPEVPEDSTGRDERSADTESALWTVAPDAAQRVIESILSRVANAGRSRDNIFNEMSSLRDKDQAGFLGMLRLLAGWDQADMPELKGLISDVEAAGRELETEHDVSAFQLLVMANLLDDKVLQSELEDMYEAAEDTNQPMPDCLVTVDKNLAKAIDEWNSYPDKWSNLSKLDASEENLAKLVSHARSLDQSVNAQLLALAKCHLAPLSTVSKTDAAEMCLDQLVGLVPRHLKDPKGKSGKAEAGKLGDFNMILEFGVFLLANLVQVERAATLPKLVKGPRFQAAAGFVWDKKQEDVKILAALSSVFEALSMNITKWQVEKSPGEWDDLAAEQQLAIQTALSKGETVIRFSVNVFPYEIDLKAMTQTNLKSKKSRKIQEVDVTSSAAGTAGGEEAEECLTNGGMSPTEKWT